MNVDLNLGVSVVASLAALLSWHQTRRMSNLTEIALKSQSYERVLTLPSVEALNVIEVDGKHRVKLIVFNQREAPIRIYAVRCFRYEPKERNIANWIRSKQGPFDWDYSQEHIFWNPKGTLDDAEHFSDVTLPFTLVRETEILLVTLEKYRQFPYQIYRFEVVTSQGTASCNGPLPKGSTSLPQEYEMTVS